MAADDDTLRAAVRQGLAEAPGMGAEAPARIDQLVEEFLPFAGSVARADRATPEARSFAWLFAYRLGDQGVAALAVTAPLAAWRDALGTEAARRVCDEVLPLLLDGYARAREDRARVELQRALGEAALVDEVSPGVVLAVATGPMDADAARSLCDRAGRLMLRREARAVLLDLSGLHEPDAGAVVELWGVTSAARMLGAHAVVVGDAPALAAALVAAGVKTDGVRRAATLAAGFEVLVRDLGVPLTRDRGWAEKAYALVRSAARRAER
jgi:hypothetical protein